MLISVHLGIFVQSSFFSHTSLQGKDCGCPEAERRPNSSGTTAWQTTMDKQSNTGILTWSLWWRSIGIF